MWKSTHFGVGGREPKIEADCLDSSYGLSAVWPEVRHVTSLSLSKMGAKLIAPYRTAVMLKWDKVSTVLAHSSYL